MDFSAPLRQGVFLVGNKRLWQNIPSMFKQFGGDEAFNAAMADIKSRPTFKLMKESGLALTDLGGRLVDREEAFVSTWAEKIPALGKGVRASERAYTGFLNKVRADVFDDLVKKYGDANIKLSENPKALKDIAKFVNAATGRGNLGQWTQAAPALSGIFFSPRLIAARANMLYPPFYIKLDPLVRQEALKSLLSFGGIATTVAGLASMAGADVETDPRSSDFAKVKVDNTRYDILGGFGQYLTLGARMATNERKTASGEVQELGKKYGSDTRLDVLLKFFVNKEAPIASYVTDYLRGSNAIGEPFDAKTAAVERFIPLIFQDAKELIEDQGAIGVPMALPGIFGIGMNTYTVDLGYDAYGRDMNELQDREGEEDDPVVLEVVRLNGLTKNPPLVRAPKSLRDQGETFTLTDEDRKEFQRVMGGFQYEFLSEDMQSEEWASADDEERIAIVKRAHEDAYKIAKRNYLYPEEE